jgi:hypothetical protein
LSSAICAFDLQMRCVNRVPIVAISLHTSVSRSSWLLCVAGVLAVLATRWGTSTTSTGISSVVCATGVEDYLPSEMAVPAHPEKAKAVAMQRTN